MYIPVFKICLLYKKENTSFFFLIIIIQITGKWIFLIRAANAKMKRRVR